MHIDIIFSLNFWNYSLIWFSLFGMIFLRILRFTCCLIDFVEGFRVLQARLLTFYVCNNSFFSGVWDFDINSCNCLSLMLNSKRDANNLFLNFSPCILKDCYVIVSNDFSYFRQEMPSSSYITNLFQTLRARSIIWSLHILLIPFQGSILMLKLQYIF